ncbi:MAG: DUF2834 domain-containing protein [Flammeovirgaceae bacterium]|jgi:hypothetical protein|nr:DUF2834 domain-containing protein [Flammeovirgaceae bacterium]|tara:strand:- start:31964 stop:32269 length:306 start_codon:yes stop_codon:yes gene_type:complete
MKKVFLMLCLLGIALPYYQLLLFIQGNGSMDQFWTEAFGSHSALMLAMDLSVSALSFLVFLIYQRVQKQIKLSQFIKYFICLFLVGFSLALPWYLYDHYDQ